MEYLIRVAGEAYRVGDGVANRVRLAMVARDPVVSVVTKDGRRADINPAMVAVMEEAADESSPQAGAFVSEFTPRFVGMLRSAILTQEEANAIALAARARVRK